MRQANLGRTRRPVVCLIQNALNNPSQIICKTIGLVSSFEYDLAMASPGQFIDDQLARGRAYFAREDASAALSLKPGALAAAITRLINKRRLANPRHGFFLILRPEDRAAGAPDPVQWIDPLMRYQGLDYRVSLQSCSGVSWLIAPGGDGVPGRGSEAVA